MNKKNKKNNDKYANERMDDINNIIDSIKTQKEFDKELKKKANKYYEKYPDLLNNYQLITDKNSLKNCKNAGCIRYVNSKGEIRYGGILLKIYNPPDSDVTFLLLKNTNNHKWNISWERNIIFYKDQVKKGDNLRNLFVTLLNDDIKN